MSIEDFILLEDYRKTLIVYNGIYLTKNDDIDYVYELYSIENFFVEVKFNRVTGKLISFLPFYDLDKLNRYLDEISLIKIFSN